MYVAFDDTDSVSSMCTTFLATEVVRELEDLDVIGWPRLVRLNPAVPWKTRGNGALCLRFGHGSGSRKPIGRIGNRTVFSCASMRSEGDLRGVMDASSKLLTRWSMINEGASPGLVVSRLPPGPGLYWQAVRGIIARGDVEEELDRIGAQRFELEGGRGVIGAAAAMSWRPRDRTYEVLAYREKNRWGTPREVDTEDAKALDRRFPSTFNNYDLVSGRPAIAPHSGCPILMGIRGDIPEDLVEAIGAVKSEAKERWLVFETNQGTDDHIIRRWSELTPNHSYQVSGMVVSTPTTVEGGHVIMQMDAEKHGALECAAYEPSRTFREVFRALRAGDEVQVLGELREEPRTLNVEKLHIITLARTDRKTSNPTCPKCNKSMQSLGKDAGFRCRVCRTKADKGSAILKSEARSITPGWYEPPVCSRRHLAMPLKRQQAHVKSRSP